MTIMDEPSGRDKQAAAAATQMTLAALVISVFLSVGKVRATPMLLATLL